MPSPAILHLPHASRVIPAEHRGAFHLPDTELDLELTRMTDAHTDHLFALEGATRVVFPVSRLVVDPERFEDDALEPMAARGMGVLYTHTSQRMPLRDAPTTEQRARLLAEWYHPHHARLTDAVNDALTAHGRALVIDAHSFASAPLPYEPDQSPDRPEICLGTDAFHTPPALLQAAQRTCESLGWSVAVNRPFAGALVPMAHYRRDLRVHAIMIEVRRDLYMDERTGERARTFDDVTQRLTHLLQQLAGA